MQDLLPDLALAHSAFNPYLFFPGRQCHGQTVTHPALRRPPYIPADRKAERVPFLFARQTAVLYTPEPLLSFIFRHFVNFLHNQLLVPVCKLRS